MAVRGLEPRRELDVDLGTFAPALRACESPIAIACFLLLTFRPLPLLSVPFFRSCIALPTLRDDAWEYFLAAIG